jgi:putative transposase
MMGQHGQESTIMGWSISNSMTKQWCIAALKEAIELNGKPMIINSDQGSQFTSAMWTHYLESESILISMDGKGRATDNTWIERFWRNIKENYIYLNPCDNGFELFEGVQNHIAYYHQKKHQTTKQTPNKRYDESIKNKAA